MMWRVNYHSVAWFISCRKSQGVCLASQLSRFAVCFVFYHWFAIPCSAHRTSERILCLRVTAPTRCDRHDRWFQIFVHLYLGKMNPFWLIYFSKGVEATSWISGRFCWYKSDPLNLVLIHSRLSFQEKVMESDICGNSGPRTFSFKKSAGHSLSRWPERFIPGTQCTACLPVYL